MALILISLYMYVCMCVCVVVGMWKDYPIAMTAYSYLFGATYMGLATLYYVFTGQYDLFWIPQRVRT